jgi:hypothetical protein
MPPPPQVNTGMVLDPDSAAYRFTVEIPLPIDTVRRRTCGHVCMVPSGLSHADEEPSGCFAMPCAPRPQMLGTLHCLVQCVAGR